MNTALKDYVDAALANAKGDREKALEHLASSFGIDQATPMMRDSLDKLLDGNPAAATLIDRKDS